MSVKDDALTLNLRNVINRMANSKVYDDPYGETYSPYDGQPTITVDSDDLSLLGQEIGAGLQNLWYSFTGQTEKTSAYKAQIEREDSAYQRLAQDLANAGLSKFTIGSASPQTGSYGNGAPQALSMIGAIADIKKANAESRKINAESIAQEQKNEVFDESHSVEMASLLSQSALNDARSKLASIEGDMAAEKITAEIGQLTADTALAWAKQAIASVDLAWSDEEHRSSVASKDSGVMLNNTKKDEIRKQIELYAQQISESIARTNNLNESSQKIVADTVIQTLMASIIAYDYDYSVSNGKRYKDNISSLLGIDPAMIGTLLSRIVTGGINGVSYLWDMLSK